MGRVYTVYTPEAGRNMQYATAYAEIFDSVSPFLNDYKKLYPEDNRRALHRCAHRLYSEMQKDIKAGKAGNTVIPPLKKIRSLKLRKIFRERADDKTFLKHMPKSSRAYLAKRNPDNLGQRLVQAIKYDKRTNPDAPKIGFTDRTAWSYGSAVQEGRRGKKYGFPNRGSQPVTAKMRRYFFAIGLYGDGKNKGRGKKSIRSQVITQVKRPVILPIYKSRVPLITKVYAEKMQKLIQSRVQRRARAVSLAVANRGRVG